MITRSIVLASGAALHKLDIVIPIAATCLPRPGRYEWVLLADGRYLATQYFIAEYQDGEEEKQ